MGIISDMATNEVLWCTMELPWINNEKNISCIPKGGYAVTPYTSNKYPNVYQINLVPNRGYILIHTGNMISDTEGCVLIGKCFGELNNEVAVLDSRIAMNELKDMIGNHEFNLFIYGGYHHDS